VTPAIHDDNGRAQIVLSGADAVTGHDPLTGLELWRRDFNARRLRNWRLVPTPVTPDLTLFAIRADGRGDVTETHVAWRSEAFLPDSVGQEWPTYLIA